MLDFTSALYLGFRHPPEALGSWSSFTTGRPAALYKPPLSHRLEAALAKLVGLERVCLGSSSLHLCWDLFGQFAKQEWAVFIDAEAYPVAQWGAERAAGRGVGVHHFPHHDPLTLRRLLYQHRGLKPLVVTDGYCPMCGKVAPLQAYLTALRRYGGLLLLDDTQALGILGARPSINQPYGHGGGGSLYYTDVTGRDILLIASLAKGFGAPLALLAGSRHNLEVFEGLSTTRVHSSPPPVVTLLAAKNALDRNRHFGEQLRRRLVSLVAYFRARLSELGLTAMNGLFPAQSLCAAGGLDMSVTHRRLWSRNIRAVLQHGHTAPQLSFLVSVTHTKADLDRLVETLDDLVGFRSQRSHFEETNHVRT